ncbi:hypothetical protein KJ807_05440, partial [Patescibacteria group bacterium]|nr:hypothetical protein [Patescibacteria group bacterium]
SEIYMSGIVSGQGLSLNELSKISKSASSVTLQRITGTDGVDRMVCHDETKFHAIVTNAIMAANDGATAFIGFKEEPGIAEPTPSDMGPSILSVYFSPLQRRFMV